MSQKSQQNSQMVDVDYKVRPLSKLHLIPWTYV